MNNCCSPPNNTFTLTAPKPAKTIVTKTHTVTEQFDEHGDLKTRITEDWEETITE